jgi:hypothetical protein
MPVLLKGHIYHNIKKGKETQYIRTICPMEDRNVDIDLFKDFEDVTQKSVSVIERDNV